MKAFVFAIIISLGLASCDETKKVIDTASQITLNGTYHVTDLEGKTLESDAPSIEFSAIEKRISGTTGCNRYFGTYDLDLYALTISEIASTEMACPQPIMNTEFVFLSALRNTGSFSLDKGVLTFYSKNDRSVLLKATKETREQN